MKIRNRILSGALASAMMASMLCGTAFAATETYANGEYVGELGMYKSGITDLTGSNLSMCNSIFAHEAEVTVTDESTIVTIYVANPLPGFPDGCDYTEGTIKDVKATYEGTVYEAEMDTTTLPMREYDKNGAMFGITPGSYASQSVTFTLPAEAVDALDEGIAVEAFVNPVMSMTQNFVMAVSDLEAGSIRADQNTMEISATVAEPVSEAVYTVTIPESVAFGSLSTEADNTKEYTVNVAASGLKEGEKIQVAAPAKGNLASGSNTLAFTNSFGTQSVSADTAEAGTDLSGTMTVTADAVKAAAAGNYTGTTSFTISYYAK